MIFSSLEFLVFLPTVLLLFFVLARLPGNCGYKTADIWLVTASLFFYGWWNPKYLGLIIALLVINYSFGLLILKHRRKALVALGVVFNLAVLGYYKYANFFIDNLNQLAETEIVLRQIILPLGISFFTFQKIAYLVDAYRGEVNEHKFLNFSLFVLFFPQLIAGPIVHHKEIMPQFREQERYRFKLDNLSIGLTIFILGLFKKLVLADNAAVFASPVFEAAAAGTELTFYEAWGAALCYTLQLYFDFSGYSDMAIGAARMFGIILPVNFNSPYKAASIIEFWHRWHMSLSRFLRDYVYITLGGNRKGKARKNLNIFLTMFLAGVWHGAGWTFVIWGLLHASLLMVNHFWRFITSRGGNIFKTLPGRFAAMVITFICVVVGWVFFRAENLESALSILNSMFGGQGIPASSKEASTNNIVALKGAKDLIIFSLLVIWLLPNSMDVMRKFNPALKFESDRQIINISWSPKIIWSAFLAVITALSLVSMAMMEKSEFLYFDF